MSSAQPAQEAALALDYWHMLLAKSARTAPAMLLLCLLGCCPVSSAQQTGSGGAHDALIDLLVWGAGEIPDVSAYAPAIRAGLEPYLGRFKAYRTKRKPPERGDMQMLHYVQEGYERRLFAVTSDRRVAALAAEYVDRLRPCYEWEGYHHCPEREAVFATEYQAAHPDGPFREYLPLLAAHRWLCAAEGYDYEEKPEGAARSRQAYERAIAVAARSSNPLIRSAAEALIARGRCHARR